VRELPPAQRPRPDRKEAAYFENDELPRLFEQLRNEPVRTLCLIALKTGMRQGELLALRWRDVDLEQAVIRVRSSYTGGVLGTPKNRERRDVDLISDVVELLKARRDGGSHDDLVFPGENGGFLSPTIVLRRHLYPAMAAARIRRGRTDTKETNIPQLQTHLRETRTRERCSDHLVVTPPWSFIAQSDNRYIRPLGAG
jgi:integrase